MEAEPSGEYIALVVRLHRSPDAAWYVSVEDASGTQTIPLAPLTCVIRLWRTDATGVLRGTIRLDGSEHWAPIQSNRQFEALVHAWLSGTSDSEGAQ